MYLDHSVSLICLIVDFSVNAVPFVKRHLVLIVLNAFIYVIINMIATFATGRPVYPPMPWTDVASYIMALVIFLFAIGFFFLIRCINHKKLSNFAKIRK